MQNTQVDELILIPVRLVNILHNNVKCSRLRELSSYFMCLLKCFNAVDSSVMVARMPRSLFGIQVPYQNGQLDYDYS